MSHHSFRQVLTGAGLAALALLAGCQKQPPPAVLPAVSVSRPLQQQVNDYDEYSGHLESPHVVTLSARVSGVVMQVPFIEGGFVKTGDVLFVIDDRPFKAEVEKTQAQAAAAEAQAQRYNLLKGTKAVSAADYDQAVAAAQQARAALTVARLNLEWTRVTAPIDGVAGRKLVTEGNLVNGGAGQATALTTITSVDPIYAYVNVPERSYLRYEQLVKESTGKASGSAYNLPCAVQLENEEDFVHVGAVDFVDNHIDPSTGTIEMRCVIRNADGALTPGLFAKMHIQSTKAHTAMLVPDAAIGSDQNTKYVSIVGPDNTVQSRTVKLGQLIKQLRVVTDGISADDQVVVNGVQSARPGGKVNPMQVTLAPDGSILPPTPAASTAPATPEKK